MFVKFSSLKRYFLRKFVQPLLSALVRNQTLRNRILVCLDHLTRDRCLEIYLYDPKKDVLAWRRSLEALFLTLEGNRFGPNNIISDSDYWMSALDKLNLNLSIVIDVGASSGFTSAYFAKQALSVFAFEPNEDNVGRINQIKKIHRINNLEVIKSAVSNQVGHASLHIKSLSGRHSLANIGRVRTISTVKVPTTTIDQFCSKRRIKKVSILKIDVEGFELEVLQGAVSSLQNKMIDIILFEYSPYFYKQRDLNPFEILKFLNNNGYELFEISGKPVNIEEARYHHDQMDLIAIPSGSILCKSLSKLG